MKGAKGPKGPPKGAGRGHLSQGGYTEEDEEILDQFCLSRRSLTCRGPYRLAVHRGEGEKLGEYDFCVQTGGLEAISDDGRTLIGHFSSHACVESPIPIERSAEVPMPSMKVLSSEVMKEIQDPANAGAFVVLPSQFNGVEFPSHCSIVESVEEYKYDHTGGPCGQLAVHPGIAQFLLDNCSTDRRPGGIDATRRVLRKVNGLLREKGISSKKHMFSIVNGYLKMPMPDSNEVAETAISALAAALPELQLLLMRDALVAGLAPSKTEFCSQSHRVNLVYASAVPVNAYVNGIGAVSKDFGDTQTHKFQRQISELFLVAQYHGALRLASEAARSTGRRSKVLLMPLGGGAFKNSWESIVKSMALATELLGPSDLDVQVLVLEGGRAGKSDERSAELRTLAEIQQTERCGQQIRDDQLRERKDLGRKALVPAMEK